MGRLIVTFTPTEFLDLLRGAKLTVAWYRNTAGEGQREVMHEYVIDMFSAVRVVTVSTNHQQDIVEVTLSGPDLPEWSPRCYPLSERCRLSRWAEEPAPYRSRRAFDLEDA